MDEQSQRRLLGRMLRGAKAGTPVRASWLSTVERSWIFCIIYAWSEIGNPTPSDDEVLLRCSLGRMLPDGSEFLLNREFLAETTEDAMRAELALIRSAS